MKRIIALLGLLSILLCGCSAPEEPAQIAATTLPVYEFTLRLCSDTGLSVTRLVAESVSCLHDYSLNVKQAKAAESAELIVVSGAGLEEFMEDILKDKPTVDASVGVELLESSHDHDQEHPHEYDAHIWLSPENALVMAQNIFSGLCGQYPQFQDIFQTNLTDLLDDIRAVQTYGAEHLQDLSCSEIITFHDGFGYLADAFGLSIVHAVEEESGSEASAAELIGIIGIVREHGLPAIFTETNGSASAASIIAAETGVAVYTLDMAMSGESWFDAMYRNIDTLKEALE